MFNNREDYLYCNAEYAAYQSLPSEDLLFLKLADTPLPEAVAKYQRYLESEKRYHARTSGQIALDALLGRQ